MALRRKTYGLYPRNFPKSVRWAVDCDYTSQLGQREREWMASFLDAHYGGKITGFTKRWPVEQKREAYRRKNAANRDLFTEHPVFYYGDGLSQAVTRGQDQVIHPEPFPDEQVNTKLLEAFTGGAIPDVPRKKRIARDRRAAYRRSSRAGEGKGRVGGRCAQGPGKPIAQSGAGGRPVRDQTRSARAAQADGGSPADVGGA